MEMEIHEPECMEREQKGDRWSNLPTLLIWMIKARLDVPHNLRLAAVCRSWQHASSSYPMQHHHAKDALPWVMLFRLNESKREFVSGSTGEKYTIDNPYFYRTRTLSSKQGWLLLAPYIRQWDASWDSNSDPPFFLLNPFLKKRIMLPYMDTFDSKAAGFHVNPFYPLCGAFTVVDGDPHRVVLLNNSFGTTDGICPHIYLWIAQPSDDKWTMHSYRCLRPHSFYGFLHILIVEQLVYCFNEHSRIFVFSMVDLQWTDKMEKADRNGKPDYFITASEGEVIKMLLDESQRFTAMYKLNSTKADWEPLKHEDTNGWTWFVNRPIKGFFLLKGDKRKTYERVCNNVEKYYPAFSRNASEMLPFINDVWMQMVDMV